MSPFRLSAALVRDGRASAQLRSGWGGRANGCRVYSVTILFSRAAAAGRTRDGGTLDATPDATLRLTTRELFGRTFAADIGDADDMLLCLQ